MVPNGVRDLTPGEPRHEYAALVALLRAQLVPPYQLSAILEETDTESAVRLVQMSEDDRLFRHDKPTHHFVGAVTDEIVRRAAADVSVWVERGYRFATVMDDEYPSALRTIFNRPPIVFFEGAWRDAEYENSVAVVGTRRASAAGIRRAERLTRELSHAGFTIFSGLASGIDTAAHVTALDAEGLTVAVMGTGINRRYPAENAGLAERIVKAGGCLVSQFFPDQPPAQWTFPNRNIVMSGLSMATVVVEASATSGAKMQARVALQHGRTVFLLKSLVDSHEWARKYVDDGAYGSRAIVISTTDDILERLSPGIEQLLSA